MSEDKEVKVSLQEILAYMDFRKLLEQILMNENCQIDKIHFIKEVNVYSLDEEPNHELINDIIKILNKHTKHNYMNSLNEGKNER